MPVSWHICPDKRNSLLGLSTVYSLFGSLSGQQHPNRQNDNNDRFHRSNLCLLIHRQELVAMSIDELVKRHTDKITKIPSLDYLIRVTNQPFIKHFC
jgi:hypothetical protein